MDKFGYSDALRYLEEIEAIGTVFGLERVEKALALLGNPERRVKFVHVAGTNGKGSVCAMLENVLRNAGYKTGLYTSPHLVSIRERIRFSGKNIGEDDFARMVGDIKEVDSSNSIGLTHFEVLTVAALLYFSEKKVDIAILETGMGGRLDATNVVSPEVTVITNISVEHSEYLGKSAVEIVNEKAGIVKSGRVLVTAEKDPEVLRVLQERCDEVGSSLVEATAVKGLEVSLKGAHQLENAGIVIKVVGELRGRGFEVSEEALRKGIAEVKWRGRFEVIEGKGSEPTVVYDAAHNPAGMKVLVDVLEEYFANKEIVFVIGVSSDKDLEAMGKEVLRVCKTAIVTEASYRARSAEEVSRELKKLGINTVVVKGAKYALAEGKRIASRKNAVLCVAGSIFLLADLFSG